MAMKGDDKSLSFVEDHPIGTRFEARKLGCARLCRRRRGSLCFQQGLLLGAEPSRGQRACPSSDPESLATSQCRVIGVTVQAITQEARRIGWK